MKEIIFTLVKDYECPVCLGTGVVEITDRYGYIEKPCNNCYDSLGRVDKEYLE